MNVESTGSMARTDTAGSLGRTEQIAFGQQKTQEAFGGTQGSPLFTDHDTPGDKLELSIKKEKEGDKVAVANNSQTNVQATVNVNPVTSAEGVIGAATSAGGSVGSSSIA